MKKKHIPLRNWSYIFWMFMIFLGVTAVFVVAGFFNVFDNMLVGIVTPFFGAFYVLVIIEEVVLLREGINIREDNTAVIGKNKEGVFELIHLEALESIDIYDRSQRNILTGKKVYRKVFVGFKLNDGRTKYREMSRISQKQLEKLRRAFDK